MKYSKEEKLLIGRRIYDDEISKEQAAQEYSISFGTARNYMWLYKDENNLPHKKPYQNQKQKPVEVAMIPIPAPQPGMEEYEAMSRDELITALVMARINEARLKKGYMVKGVGAKKKFISINSKSIR